ncbi:hypothetical protein [Mycobacterium sp. DL440]|uniref:hypothetical protein n=1 Tax=Mycobacterium sp. DL440 TaxID=2675523 RepID=UPI001422DF9A|nr:hypothetical protein [Mycobacterium sp. DL440]
MLAQPRIETLLECEDRPKPLIRATFGDTVIVSATPMGDDGHWMVSPAGEAYRQIGQHYLAPFFVPTHAEAAYAVQAIAAYHVAAVTR